MLTIDACSSADCASITSISLSAQLQRQIVIYL